MSFIFGPNPRFICLASLFALFAITKCYERGKKVIAKTRHIVNVSIPLNLVTLNQASKGLNFESHGCRLNKENTFLADLMLECLDIQFPFRFM